MARSFVAQAGPEYKPIKADHGLWIKIFRYLKDKGATAQDVDRAVLFSRANNLVLSGPQSIQNIALDKNAVPRKEAKDITLADQGFEIFHAPTPTNKENTSVKR